MPLYFNFNFLRMTCAYICRRKTDGVDRDLDNTPDRIVERLDEFVIAQEDAKKAV